MVYGKENLLVVRDKLWVKLEKRFSKMQKVVDVNLSNDFGVIMVQFKVMKKKLVKVEGCLECGIEIMFRLIFWNYLDFSGMVDSKVNIMIFINFIIMFVVMGSLMLKLDFNEYLYYFMVFLFLVNLVFLIYVILFFCFNVLDGKFI